MPGRERFLQIQGHQIKAWGKTNLVCASVVFGDIYLLFMWNVFYKWVFEISMLRGLQIKNLQCFAAFQSEFSIYYKRRYSSCSLGLAISKLFLASNSPSSSSSSSSVVSAAKDRVSTCFWRACSLLS